MTLHNKLSKSEKKSRRIKKCTMYWSTKENIVILLIRKNQITHKGKVYLSFWVQSKIRFIKIWHLVFFSNLYMILRRKKEQDQVLLIVHMSPVLWLDKNPLRGQVDALRDEKTLLFRIFCCYYFIQLHSFLYFFYKSLPPMMTKNIAMYWNLCCNKPYVWNRFTIREFEFNILKYDVLLKLQTITYIY